MRKGILFIFLFLVAIPLVTEASSLKSIKMTESTPVFDEKQKVAVFLKGTSHTVTKETDRYYHTVIGNDEVKFSKKSAKVINNVPENWKGAHPVRAKTAKHTQIVDRPAVQAKIIGHIQPNMTIHVQRLKGQYYPVIMGGQTGYIHKSQLETLPGIPVLMYHDIIQGTSDQNMSKLELKKFKEQMDYLKKNGWTTITPQQLELWVKKKIALPKKAVFITFDDGYKSTIELAYPILKNHGFKATSFLITSRIDRPDMVSEGDIYRTQDIFSYQNHTHAFHMFNSYTNKSLLESESEESILSDIQQANQIIEQILDEGSTVTTHAYPYGKRSSQAISALQSAGITSAYTIDEGNVFQGDSLFDLKRQRVHSKMSLKDFAEKLQGK